MYYIKQRRQFNIIYCIKNMTIKEIAKLAKVSRSTVSRYLNDGYVSEKNKKIISKIIEETGYRPSTQAQMLRTKKTKFIGVIIPKINSSSISKMVAGISEVLCEKGYRMLLACTENDKQREINYLNLFKSNYVDGVILMGTIFTDLHKNTMKKMNVPLALLGQKLDKYSCVYHDDYNAAKSLAAHLFESSKRVLYIGVTISDNAVGYERRKGFYDALSESDAKLVAEIETGFNIEDGYLSVKELKGTIPEIDAIFCVTDSIAFGVIKYLNEIKYKIPDNIKIVGMGNSDMSSIISPSLTTVKYHYKESGREVAKLLIDSVDNEVKSTRELKLGCELLIRESSF